MSYFDGVKFLRISIYSSVTYNSLMIFENSIDIIHFFFLYIQTVCPYSVIRMLLYSSPRPRIKLKVPIMILNLNVRYLTHSKNNTKWRSMTLNKMY